MKPESSDNVPSCYTCIYPVTYRITVGLGGGANNSGKMDNKEF